MKNSPDCKNDVEALPSNGKAEAFLLLKKRIDVFGKYAPEPNLRQKVMKVVLSSAGVFLTWFMLLSPIMISVALTMFSWTSLNGHFTGTAKGFGLFCLSILLSFSTIGVIMFSLSKFEDFKTRIYCSKLYKWLKKYTENVYSGYWEKFANSFGFSQRSPKMENLMEVQDFTFWQMQIAKNFTDFSIYRKLECIFTQLTSTCLTERYFKVIVPDLMVLSDDLFKAAMANKEFYEIYNQLCIDRYGSSGVGDFSDGNKDRLLKMIKSS